MNTDNGLLVPVLKNADRKKILEINTELNNLIEKARKGRLEFQELEGSTFSISSLGSIGGTGFTPIVNPPEAAILGISRMRIKPVWNGEVFKPATILPLSVTYDHRIIDGAECAYFTKYLCEVLSDIRNILV